MICPHRLLERRKIFADCIHLLTLHEPGNELHIIPEVTLPGGNVDYFLASARSGRVRDFIGIELQTLDSTGTVWPERQRFLSSVGFAAEPSDLDSEKPFGMNWKMTAKTILVQLHHKIETFEHLNKHLVLVAPREVRTRSPCASPSKGLILMCRRGPGSVLSRYSPGWGNQGPHPGLSRF